MITNVLAKDIPQKKRNETFRGESMNADAPEMQLVRRMAANDPAALEELYALYGQRLYALAVRLTGDPARAEDVLQDSLLAAWKAAGRFRGEGRVIAWLLSIVHNTALKSLRRPTFEISEAMEETLPAADAPLEEQAQRSQQAHRLREGLQNLSPEHRAVLELVFYQGMSMDETAHICRCPVGTVKSRLNYAKAALRGVLTRAGINGEDVK
jgi:RNA polymerase sigma-70 factor (ECF subfamily)